MTAEPILFGRPSLDEEEIEAVVAVLREGWIGMGPRVEAFERDMAVYFPARHVVAVSSCTAALHLALLAHGIGPGDEVITTPLTFVATGNAILYTGASPVFVDIDPSTLNMDHTKIAAAASPRTKAILPVHFGGLPCEMDTIREIATAHRWALIEDAAHAIGASYRGTRVGARGTACFSFYPNKNMTTIEGGAIATDSDAVAEKAKILRLHGLSSHAWSRYRDSRVISTNMTELGYKYNMTDISAAIGIVQLRKFPRFQEIRERQVVLYNQAWAESDDIGVAQNPVPDHLVHAHHLYIVLLRAGIGPAIRNTLIQKLREAGIGASIHYQPLYREPYYAARFGLSPEDYPACEDIYRRCMTLPISPFYEDHHIRRVIATVNSTLKELRA